MRPVPNETLAQDTGAGSGARVMSIPLTGSVAAIRLDPKGRISEATVSAAAMLGFEPQELRGRTLKDLALEGWQAAADMAAARVRFGATESFELALKGRSGRRTLVEMTARAGADDESGAVIAWSERRLRRSGAPNDGGADLKRVAYGLLRTQEAERMRVAFELHDEVAPVVNLVKYMIEDAVGRIGAAAPEHTAEGTAESARILHAAALRLRDVIAALHRISTELRPRLLDDLGLVPTLEWYCRGVEAAAGGVHVECRLSASEADIPESLKLDIFRIVQEALNNVLEHAQASHVQVCLAGSADELSLTIEDDGKGFDPGAANAKRDGGVTLGLQSIRKRVEATGGRFLLESQGPARGTRIGGSWRRVPGARHNAG
jgi:two-component system NarL family sensor kinase